MKRFKYLYILFGTLCLPLVMHAQVVRITGGANLVITGDVKLVLHDGTSDNHGSIGAYSTPLSLTGYSDKTSITAAKNLPITNNILIDKSYGNTWVTNDNVYIFLGKELAFKKPTGIQTFMRAWPNPTTERFTLTVSSDKTVVGTIALQDASGQILERKRVSYTTGVTTIQWDMTKYAVGSYLLVFEDAPGKYLRVVKQ